jgi:antitoxin (DNA-binding transcriptional repressor) of toxin-antitoxin stability system
MAVVHISEAEAIRDFAALLAHVRAGTEVVIESELTPVAVLVPPEQNVALDPEHDTWFRAKVQQALDDTRPDAPDEEVEAHFAQRRAASLLKATGTGG